MSAPAVQDASWLSYSCRTVKLRGRAGGGGGWYGVGGGGGGCSGEAVSAPTVQDASWHMLLMSNCYT